MPIAIVGIGCMFPGSPDRHAFWVNLRDGVDAIRDVPESHWDPRDYWDADPSAPDMTYARRGGFLSPVRFFPRDFGISPRDIEATDTTQLLGLVGSRMALEDAGYGEGGRSFDHERASVILGVTGALELVIDLGARLGHPIWRRALHESGIDGQLADDIVGRILDAYVPWQENSFPGLLGNVAAGRIANRLDLRGTNCVVDAACASSLAAVHLAMLELETGRADMVLTGGIDTFNDIFMYMCFSKTPALSPTGDARPFDANADGTILGEGLGIVVLKRLADAERDGDRIYAVIKGMGTSSDGRGTAIYAPSASGQARALRSAHRAAGVDARTVELVEAHGTGTRVGDATELAGLDEVFRAGAPTQQAAWCALGSVKSMIGHTKAAAGAAGLIKAALALHHRVLPPTIKVERPLEAIQGTPFHIATEKRPWLARAGHPRRAGVSAFGFGGSNLHAVLEEHRSSEGSPWDGRVQIFAFSADSRAALAIALREAEGLVEKMGVRAAAARSRVHFDSGAAARLLLVHEGAGAAFAELVERGRRSLDREGATAHAGVCFEEGVAGGLALLFPGQGSQYPGMLVDLACAFPRMRTTIEDFASSSRSSLGRELGDYIYPPTAFDPATRTAQEAALRATEVAQVAIGAVSLGAWEVLRGFAVTPSMTAGHSYGELVALAVAARIDASELARLSCVRGQLMAAGRGGTMLAVIDAIERVEATLAEHRLDLTVANRNAPDQAVVSGSVVEVERARQIFAAAGVRAIPLDVGAAFHSPLVADAEAPFADAMSATAFALGSAQVFSNSSASAYPEEASACRDLLAGQLARPVRFVEMIDAMYRAGARTFLEVGPGNRLGGLVSRILAHERIGAGGGDVRVLALDPGNGARSGELALAQVLARLAARGHTVDLARWDEDAPSSNDDRGECDRGFSVALTGANYVSKRLERSPTHEPSDPPDLEDRSPPAASESRSVDASTPSSAILALQEQLATLLRIQEQTTELHRRFLDGQARASESAYAALRAQQILLGGERSDFALAPLPDHPTETIMPTASVAASRDGSGSPVTSPPSKAGSPPAIVDPPPSRAVGSGPTSRAARPMVDPRSDFDRRRVEAALFAVVADKTGYPEEMLDLSMGLDSDLGIDSIKRVEILSALHEALPGAPRVSPEHLGELHTLGQLADFLGGPVREPPDRPASTGRAIASASSRETAQQVLLEIVSDKTGYPVEMLELSMGLDTDLGIDSIKRVEILAALRERLPTAPIVEPAHLGELQTLGHIVAFLAGTGDLVVAQGASVAAAGPRESRLPRLEKGRSGTVDVLLAVVGEKTGYPVEMLDLSMGLDEDLGIDSIKRVEILAALQERLPNAPVIGPDRLGDLRTLGQLAEFLTSPATSAGEASGGRMRTGAEADGFSGKSAPPVAGGPGIDRYRVRVVPLAPPEPTLGISDAPIWVTRSEDGLSAAIVAELRARGRDAHEIELPINGRTPPDRLGGLVIVAPIDLAGPGDDLLVGAFVALRGLVPRLLRGGEGALFATVSRLDGAFGFESLLASCPSLESGGFAGLAKTASLEWPELRCRAFDLSAETKGSEQLSRAARRIVDELLSRGPIEIGILADLSVGLEVVPARLPDLAAVGSLLELAPGETIIVTGGARGVTAEAAVAIAEAGGRDLVLIGRTPPPTDEPEWLRDLDEPVEIKRALLARALEAISPVEVEAQHAAIRAARDLRRTFARLAAVGAHVDYRCVDVRDGSALDSLVRELVGAGKRIVGLVHGAGVLADRRIEDKSEEDFLRVLSTKIGGLRVLLAAIPETTLRLLVFFSSTSARYGRRGQVDYAVANELLNKWAQGVARSRAACRVLALGWGPWNGGMVTPGLRRLFDEEGIAVIELASGARQLVAELRAGTGEAGPEILLLGAGSRMPADPELTRRSAAASDLLGDARPPELPIVFERRVGLDSHPVLASHVIDGRPVLPTVLMVEWLAHGALHGNPGLHFRGVDEFRLYKGAIIEEGSTLTLRICAGPAKREGEEYRVAAQLVSGGGNGHRIIHAVCDVVLANGIAPARASAGAIPRDCLPPIARPLRAFPAPLADIYDRFLFHGPAMQGIAVIEGLSETEIAGSAYAHPWPRPADWMRDPHRGRWITMPLAVDVGFQLMVLWGMCEQGVGSLPTRFAEFRQYEAEMPREAVEIVAQVVERHEHRVVADILWRSQDDGRVLARMSGYECVSDASLNAAFRRNRVAGDASACI